MRRSLIVGVAVLLLAMPLAGCLSSTQQANNSSQGPTDTPDGVGTDPDASTPSTPAGSTMLRFPGEAPEATGSRNGSFQSTDACVPNCLASFSSNTSYEHTLPLGSPIPLNTPTTINAELTYQADGSATMGLFLHAPGEDTIVYENRTVAQQASPGQRSVTLNATLAQRAQAPVQLVIQYTAPDPGMEDTCQLRYHVQPTNTTLEPGIPTAVDMQGLPNIQASLAENASETRVMLWDAADTFRGHQNLTTRTQLDLSEQTSGEIVLLVPENQPSIQLSTATTLTDPDRLRPLATETEVGPGHQVPQQGPVTWETQTERVPIAMGLYLASSIPENNQAGQPVLDVQAGLDGPRGTVVSVNEAFAAPLFTTWVSPIGAKTLVSGSFNGSFQATGGAQMTVGTVQTHYAR